MDDSTARRLRDAAEARRLCRVGRPGSGWVPAAVVRPDPAGLIVDAPGHDLSPGEVARIWLDDDDGPLRFEGAVVRVAVTVPSRGAGGLLVGDLTEVPDEARPDAALQLEIRIPGGGALSLVDPPVRLVDVSARALSFEVPRAFPVVFPERGVLRVRLGVGGQQTQARARVDHLVAGTARTLYTIAVLDVEHREVYQAVLTALRGR